MNRKILGKFADRRVEIVLIGTKSDLPRKIPYQVAEVKIYKLNKLNKK